MKVTKSISFFWSFSEVWRYLWPKVIDASTPRQETRLYTWLVFCLLVDSQRDEARKVK